MPHTITQDCAGWGTGLSPYCLSFRGLPLGSRAGRLQAVAGFRPKEPGAPHTNDLEALSDTLISLDRMVADSSSLILAEKAGFLPLLCREVRLVVVPGVLAETGFASNVFRTLEGYDETPTDAAVVRAARETSLPLLSDDRSMLEQAHIAGMRYYNAIMALTLLLARGALTPDAFERFRGELYRHCRYSTQVRRFAESLYWSVRKRLP